MMIEPKPKLGAHALRKLSPDSSRYRDCFSLTDFRLAVDESLSAKCRNLLQLPVQPEFEECYACVARGARSRGLLPESSPFSSDRPRVQASGLAQTNGKTGGCSRRDRELRVSPENGRPIY